MTEQPRLDYERKVIQAEEQRSLDSFVVAPAVPVSQAIQTTPATGTGNAAEVIDFDD